MSRQPLRPPADDRTPRVAPFVAAEREHEQNLADEMTRINEALREFADSEIRAGIWLKPASGVGTWAWCDDATVPLDLPSIMADMRERFGPGSYEIRVTAKGRIRANATFSISKERAAPAAPAAPPPAQGMGQAELFAMMMQQGENARRDAAAAAERQMTMLTTLAGAIIPALIQRPPTPGTDLVGLVAALNTGKGGGMKETLESLSLMKEILGAGAGRDDDDGDGIRLDPANLVESGARLIGPAVKALGDLVQSRRDAAAPGAAAGPPAPEAVAPLQLAAPASRYRLIELVRVDVSYFFGRGFAPAKAADLVYDIIEANHVTEAEIAELAPFAFSPTGLEDLAREGIDLRSNPAWAAEFFAELSAIHSGEADDSDGTGGGSGNAAGNGADHTGGAP